VPSDGTTGGKGSTHPRRITEQPGLFADVCASVISTSQPGSDNGATGGLERHQFDISRSDRGRERLSTIEIQSCTQSVSQPSRSYLRQQATQPRRPHANNTAPTMAVGQTFGVQGLEASEWRSRIHKCFILGWEEIWR
jgi:hypothetical protein